VPRYRILRLRGASVGVIGLAPPDLPVLTMRENVRDLDVLDPAIAVRQAIDELGRNFNVNIIIVLSHMGLDADSALAEEVGDIDVIIGGHSHTVLAAPRRVNGTIIAQAGERGQWLGRIDASFDAATGVLLSHHGRLIPTRADLVIPDPVVAAKVAELEALVDAGLSEKIAVLENDWVRVLDGECNIGNWQVDVMRDFAKADVAFQNIGGIRKDMQAGPLTLRDMWEISPFGNEFVTFTVTGAQLLDMLRYQARVSNEFCQVSGLRYRYDFTADADVALRADVAGNPIDSARTYLIATNSYVGGHLHDVFGLPERDIEVSPVLPAAVGRDVFIDYARKQAESDFLENRGTNHHHRRTAMKHFFSFCAVIVMPLLAGLWLGACDDDGVRPGDEIVFPDKDVSYAAHVQPFFTLRCGNYGCHEDQTRAGNLSLTSYVAMTERPGIVIAGSSESSLLMQKLDGRLPHPIEVPVIINQNQLTGIKTWINEGAKNN
jgi:2',3'-cyclic-nucleotide 2'-phosphodiesterase (5'-nucleotidase family)